MTLLHSSFNYEYLKCIDLDTLFELTIKVIKDNNDKELKEYYFNDLLVKRISGYKDIKVYEEWKKEIQQASANQNITNDEFDAIVKDAEETKKLFTKEGE